MFHDKHVSDVVIFVLALVSRQRKQRFGVRIDVNIHRFRVVSTTNDLVAIAIAMTFAMVAAAAAGVVVVAR